MKQTYYINLFAIGLPITLGVLGIIESVFLLYCLLSTILTGLIQFVLGMKLLLERPGHHHLKIYFYTVIFYFFIGIIITFNSEYIEILQYPLLITPPILAIYLTIIITQLKNGNSHNFKTTK